MQKGQEGRNTGKTKTIEKQHTEKVESTEKQKSLKK